MTWNCADTYTVFFKPGEVVEIRAYGLKGRNKAWDGFAGGPGIVFGYFDNHEAFGKAADALEEAKGHGIYFTLNPVLPDLLARAANRLKAADGKTPSTSDKEIRVIRWLPVDLDPIRPSGISSSDAELAEAIALRRQIESWMSDVLGWDPEVRAMSGNGAHLVYRLPDELPLANRENPSDDPSVKRIRQALAAINSHCENKAVDIDMKVFNPSRIWKLYGTTGRKGDSTPTRPHRKSYIEINKD
jgi:hypothetical protein